MTERTTPRLVLRANLSDEPRIAEDPSPSASEPFSQANLSFRDPAFGDDFYDDSASVNESSSKASVSMEDPVTPAKMSTDFTAQQLQQLHNESKTTVSLTGRSPGQSEGLSDQFNSSPAQFIGSTVPQGSPVPQSSNPQSRRVSLVLRSSSDLRALRDEQGQEQRIVDYLQAVNLGLASLPGDAIFEPASNSADSGVDSIRRVCTDMMSPADDPLAYTAPTPAPLQDISDDQARLRSLSRTRRGLQRLKRRKPKRCPSEHDGNVSTASQHLPAPSSSFRARRVREDVNWFSGSRAAKTLPSGFGPPAGLGELANGSLRGRSSKSASLRLRNERLPAAYSLPYEQAPLVVASASVPHDEGVDKRQPIGRLSLWPLNTSPGRRIAVPIIPDPDGEEYFAPVPLNVPQRSAPDLTIDMTMSGALPESGTASNRESLYSGTLQEFDVGIRPDVRPESPDRPSGRNSALLSNRGSVVFPIPEPLSKPETPAVKPELPQPERTPWTTGVVLAVVWATAFALTVFGISRVFPPNHHAPACTLERAHTCVSPSLSFVHTLRLNTTLPTVLHPYLPLVQSADVNDVDLADRGIDVSLQDGATSMYVSGGMSIATAFADNKAILMSNITYYGLVDGNGSLKSAKRRLDAFMKLARDSRNSDMAKVVGAQGADRSVFISKDGSSVGMQLFALWLGSLLAVELTLFAHSVIMMLALWYWTKKGGIVGRRESSWKQDVLSASGLALQLLLVGILGTAAASGILIAFWTC